MPAALRPPGVTQIVMSQGGLESYVFLQLATKVAKAMNDKAFAEISMSIIPRFQNLARKLL